MKRVPEEVYVSNVPAIKTFLLLHTYWHLGLIQCLLNWMEGVDYSRCDSDQRVPSRNVLDSKLQNFCAQLFQLRNYFCAQHFRNVLAYNVFNFTVHCATTHQSPVGDTQRPYDQVKDIAVV